MPLFLAPADGIDNTGFVPDDLPPPPPTDTTADEVITTAPAAAAVVATSIPGSDQGKPVLKAQIKHQISSSQPPLFLGCFLPKWGFGPKRG